MSLLFSRLENPSPLSLSSYHKCSKAFIIFSAFFWAHPHSSLLYYYFCTQIRQMWPDHCWAEGEHVLTTICQISLSFTKFSNQPGPGLWAHMSAAPLAGRWQTSNACDHFPCGGHRHFIELRENKEDLFTPFTWLVCAHPAILTWHGLSSLADQHRQ